MANLTGAILDGADLSGARINRGYLAGASLKKARLVGADLELSRLMRADFSDADLTAASPKPRAPRMRCFTATALIATNLQETIQRRQLLGRRPWKDGDSLRDFP